MASIEKRTDTTGATSYRVKIRLKGYPVQSATFPRLTDARKWATQTEAALQEGRHFKTAEAKRHTLEDMLERYRREILPTKRDGRHQNFQLDWWIAKLGTRTLADCTPALIAEYREILAREPMQPQASHIRRTRARPDETPRYRANATVVRYLAVLSHAFTVAMKEWGWVDDNPCRKVTKPKEPRGRVRFLSDDERHRLLDACRASRSTAIYAVVVLALSTGARQGEIMNLRWGHIDFTRRTATLHQTKNGERRVLPLSGPALALLKERAKIRRIDTDLVFPGEDDPSRPIALQGAWEFALKKAGIEDFRFHDLRHSAASYLAMNGASLAEIAEVLGHKTLAMVKRYSHLSDSHVAGVVERMNSAIFGEGA